MINLLLLGLIEAASMGFGTGPRHLSLEVQYSEWRSRGVEVPREILDLPEDAKPLARIMLSSVVGTPFFSEVTLGSERWQFAGVVEGVQPDGIVAEICARYWRHEKIGGLTESGTKSRMVVRWGKHQVIGSGAITEDGSIRACSIRAIGSADFAILEPEGQRELDARAWFVEKIRCLKKAGAAK